MKAQDSCVAFLGAGGIGNIPLIVKAANSPTWLSSEQTGTSHQFMGRITAAVRTIRIAHAHENRIHATMGANPCGPPVNGNRGVERDTQARLLRT